MNIYSSLMHNQQNLKQPRWLSTRECINKLWHIRVMKCYPALLIHTTTRIDLKRILLSERSQNQKAPYCMKPYMWYCGKDKTIQIENRAVVATSWGVQKMTMKRQQRKVLEWWDCFVRDFGGGHMTLCLSKPMELYITKSEFYCMQMKIFKASTRMWGRR